MDIVKSNRGKDKVVKNGYIYRRDKNSGKFVSWRCEVPKCLGRLKTHLSYESEAECWETGTHFHDPDQTKIELAKVKTLKVTAKSLAASRRPSDTIEKVSTETTALIGSGSSGKRKRKGSCPVPLVTLGDISALPDCTSLLNHQRQEMIVCGEDESLYVWKQENYDCLLDSRYQSQALKLDIYVHIMPQNAHMYTTQHFKLQYC